MTDLSDHLDELADSTTLVIRTTDETWHVIRRDAANGEADERWFHLDDPDPEPLLWRVAIQHAVAIWHLGNLIAHADQSARTDRRPR